MNTVSAQNPKARGMMSQAGWVKNLELRNPQKYSISLWDLCGNSLISIYQNIIEFIIIELLLNFQQHFWRSYTQYLWEPQDCYS